MAEFASGQDEATLLFWLATQEGKMRYLPGEGGGGCAGYVLLASQNPCPTLVYPVAKYSLSHFLENVIFTIPTL